MNTHPRILHVGEEPPPLAEAEDGTHHTGKKREMPKGKTATAKNRASDRFRTLNAFVDCTIADLSRAELAVWLVLYRDARDGGSRTAQTDIARRRVRPANRSPRHSAAGTARLAQGDLPGWTWTRPLLLPAPGAPAPRVTWASHCRVTFRCFSR